MLQKIAVVTGSNKGIGYGIVKALCKRRLGVVYLTARDVNRGIQAVESLRKENLNVLFHQLDVTDKESVMTFSEHLKNKHGGLDILVNNAAVINKNVNKVTYEDANHVIDVNYRSYFNVQEYLFPALNENARVINISSNAGHLSNIKNEYWVKRLRSDNLEVKDIDDFVDWFLNSVKNNTLKVEDFGSLFVLAYRISKVAVSALTRVQQKYIGRGISINSLHPGFVKTDMTKNMGFLTVEEASETAVYLALDCDQSVKGKYFWFDKTEKDWADTSMELLDMNDDVMKEFAEYLTKFDQQNT